jgi:hypothetical protein
MTTTEVKKVGSHTVEIEKLGNRATIRVNGIGICFNSPGWKKVVEGIEAGKYDQYIQEHCGRRM